MTSKALDKQIGGQHYKDLAIQPMEYSIKNNLDALQHTVIKYITRHKTKNGVEDIEKAIHACELIKQMQYSYEDNKVTGDYHEGWEEGYKAAEKLHSQGSAGETEPTEGDTQHLASEACASKEETTTERTLPKAGDILKVKVDGFSDAPFFAGKLVKVLAADEESIITTCGESFDMDSWHEGLEIVND